MTPDDIRARIDELNAAAEGRTFTAEERTEWNQLNAQLDEMRKRLQRVQDLYEAGSFEDGRSGFRQVSRDGNEAGGRRTVERHHRAGTLTDTAAATLDRFLRNDDILGLDGAYIAAVGDEHYGRAFAKIMADPLHGHLRFTPQETAAMQRVNNVEAQRGMVEGTGSAGGFALPITIDPTILLTNNGALNPIREVARVMQVATREWRGVSSAGVTASYDAEASEVSDDTPTLAQPTITTAMGRVFVPFSFELGDDWQGIGSELERITTDARAVLDATAFLTGTGTNEPAGVLTGLTVSQRVQTNAVATFAVGDPWLLKAGLPARFITNTSVLANPTIFDTTYRFTGGNATEPPIMPTRGGECFGRPAYEWSTMVATTTTGSKIMLAGDFREGYTIADRIGMSAELIPHLFGANRRPTGERGFFARWRTGAAVVNAAALRYLEVK